MYVCICNTVTEQQIRDAADAGVKDLWDLEAVLGVAGNCGSCRETAANILRKSRAKRRHTEPGIYVPSVA